MPTLAWWQVLLRLSPAQALTLVVLGAGAVGWTAASLVRAQRSRRASKETRCVRCGYRWPSDCRCSAAERDAETRRSWWKKDYGRRRPGAPSE